MQELYEKMGLFYLGQNKANELSLYKSKHLTTHAILVGMTGSGKTGLGIGLIEEAAIDNIPSIIIDPKGDMGNLCLAFENLSAEEFEPWMEDPKKAEQTSTMWKEGLVNSGQKVTRVRKFASVDKTIYTPGSSYGVAVNILGSFAAPSKDIVEDHDTLASLINTSVSSLLGLLSINADPINSKEHQLLSNIFYYCYTREISLTLEDIIGYIASPPFERIGMMSLRTFYPQKERMKLSMALNGLISSVNFSSWLRGQALDIQNMLYDANGKAKVAIFSISHLNDNERMFFVTILLNAYINWMRKQRGSSTLKNILYMDEIFGFFPPSKNPPSKEPMLLLLKQARAFGTGVVLSTQNPVDLDYKGLSNIGTWFVGKLQTKQDIDKVLDPLMAKSTLTKEELRHKLAILRGRNFFLKNVHTDETVEFATRWVLSYLKGPMTRDDISRLMQSKKEKMQEEKELTPSLVEDNGSQLNKPILHKNIKEYFHDTNMNSTAAFYPNIYASIQIRLFNQKRAIDTINNSQIKLEINDTQTILPWENAHKENLLNFSTRETKGKHYSPLPEIITNATSFRDIKKSLSNYLYTSQKIELYTSKALKLESNLGQTKQEFIVVMENALKELRDEKTEKIENKFEVKFTRLHDRVMKLEMQLEKEEIDVSSKTSDTLMDIGIAILGVFFGKKALSAATMRKTSSVFRKGRGVLKEKNDVKNMIARINATNEKIEKLKEDFEDAVDAIQDDFNINNYPITSFFITPRRSDIVIKEMALLWER